MANRKSVHERVQHRSIQERFATLSERQRQLVQLIAEGRDRKEIAGILKICEKSVKVYVSEIFKHVGINGALGNGRIKLVNLWRIYEETRTDR